MTLIEVVIVLVIAILLMGGMVFASGAIQRSRLKSGASRVAAAMRVGFQRASSTGKRVRLVLDFDNNTLWLEDSSDQMLVKENDVLGTGGADPATAAERAAQEEAARINAGPMAARASFMAVAGPAGEPQPLQQGIVFKAVDAQHEKEPRTSGRGYVYFFASEAERASVQVKIANSDDDHDVFSVVVAPLTGKATIMDGTVNVPHPRDDDQEASEVEDDGH
jgi:type II secretory pathway pseudopilin PulG